MLWKRFELLLWHIFGNLEDVKTAAQHALAPHHPHVAIQEDAGSVFPGSTCNTPANRRCWTDGFDIETNYEEKTPAGVVRDFLLIATNEYIAPDGFNTSRMLFNGSYPGPTLEGNWGDTFNITIVNNLINHNGTSVHWHGIRQLNSNWYDGVSGVTECPIPPGESATYTWRATQYGVSWYHSHFSLQYPDGLVGAIKINGPSSMNYDIDVGPVLLTDWFHNSAFSMVQLEYLGRPPSPDSMLMNGNGTFYCCSSCKSSNVVPGCVGGSKLTEFHFEEGKTYKMSLVNTATSTHMTFWIDNHSFSVISADFVPIEPYTTSTLNIAIGQRYDILITANATKDDYWMHARDCQNGGARSNLGIIRYDRNSNIIPYTPHISDKHLCYGCLDELHTNLKPIVKMNVKPAANVQYEKDSLKVHLVGFPDEFDQSSVLHKWVLKDSSFYLDWTQPTLSLLNIAAGQNWTDTPFPRGYEPIYLDRYKTNDWVYFLIEGKFQDSLDNSTRKIYKTQAPVAHPMHIHGHDFAILATGTEEFDPKNVTLNTTNPPRRDVALLPVNGYLIIAFQINNPGAWLMHCHIAWHASGGLALQFIEKPNDLTTAFDKSGIESKFAGQCTNWAAYYTVFNKNLKATQEDSGI